MIFKINVNDCNSGLFHIGRVAENDVTQIDWLEHLTIQSMYTTLTS